MYIFPVNEFRSSSYMPGNDVQWGNDKESSKRRLTLDKLTIPGVQKKPAKCSRGQNFYPISNRFDFLDTVLNNEESSENY